MNPRAPGLCTPRPPSWRDINLARTTRSHALECGPIPGGRYGAQTADGSARYACCRRSLRLAGVGGQTWLHLGCQRHLFDVAVCCFEGGLTGVLRSRRAAAHSNRGSNPEHPRKYDAPWRRPKRAARARLVAFQSKNGVFYAYPPVSGGKLGAGVGFEPTTFRL